MGVTENMQTFETYFAYKDTVPTNSLFCVCELSGEPVNALGSRKPPAVVRPPGGKGPDPLRTLWPMLGVRGGAANIVIPKLVQTPSMTGAEQEKRSFL